MIVGGVAGSPALSGFLSVRGASRRIAVPGPAVDPAEIGAVREFLDAAFALRDGLRRLPDDLRARRLSGRDAAPPRVQTADLGLGLQATPTRLRSTEEVNTIATSYGPVEPAIQGSSTSGVTLAGIYSGAQDDIVDFTIQGAGSVGGILPIQVRATGRNGSIDETFTIASFEAPGTPHVLSNGLEVSFSAGSLGFGDTFSVDVFASVGSAVDPTRSFDGTGAAAPGFDPGEQVTAGSFTVNGVPITVGAADTIDDVLARISGSGADVLATFDAATESVILERLTAGSQAGIVVADDTSGFVSAVKLAGASGEPGADDERTVSLASVAAFAGIAAGSFEINGITLSVDPATDSLEDLLARIAGAGAGVEATFDPGRGRLELAGLDPETPLELADGSSGLFSVLGLAPGSYAPTEAREGRGRRARNPAAFVSGVERLASSLSAVFAAETPGLSGRSAQRAKDRLGTAIGLALDDTFGDRAVGLRALQEKLGLGLDLTGRAETFATVDRSRLAEGATRSAAALTDLLEDRGDRAGLIRALDTAIADSVAEITAELAGRGVYVDLRA